MSEKRFTLDDESRYIMEYGMPMTIFDVIRVLNEQQDTIDKLRVDIKATRTTIKHLNNKCKDLVSMFEKEVKENEKLRKDLNDCEKVRYTVFKKIEEKVMNDE